MKDGGKAFPQERMKMEGGMSLRDWFAGQALHGIAHYQRHQGIPYPDYAADILEPAAELAYQMADAMLAEREKEEPCD